MLDTVGGLEGIVEQLKALVLGTKPTVQANDLITVTKQIDGRTRVLLRVSNMFKDRHGEIITSDAHKEYVQYVEENKDYPEFWLWHTPGSRWGKADLVSFDDGFLTVSGLADVGKEYIAEVLAEQKDIGVSHGFKGLSIAGEGSGYIDWYRSFEASPLPKSEAANVWTAYMLAKERAGVALQDKHKKFFDTLGIPATIVQGWDAQNKSLSDVLKEAGIEYKELSMEEGTEIKPSTTISISSGSTATTEVVLPDGTKALVPVSAIQKPEPVSVKENGTNNEALVAILGAVKGIGARIDSIDGKLIEIDTKQKQLEAKVNSDDDVVSKALEASIKAGKGFVASKEGDAPTSSVVVESQEWEKQLAEFITGGK